MQIIADNKTLLAAFQLFVCNVIFIQIEMYVH